MALHARLFAILVVVYADDLTFVVEHDPLSVPCHVPVFPYAHRAIEVNHPHDSVHLASRELDLFDVLPIVDYEVETLSSAPVFFGAADVLVDHWHSVYGLDLAD